VNVIETEGKHYKRHIDPRGKHYRYEPRKKRRKIKRIVLAELLCVMVAFYGVFLTSCHNVLMRTAEKAYAIIMQVKGDQVGAETKVAIKKCWERLVEEVDEIVWTKEEVQYRTGPDDSYDTAGTLDKEQLVQRTGLTNNEWSRVSIDEDTYYISSSDLTTETPISAIIEGGQKGEYQKYALSLFPDYGWSDRELEPLINLWNRESHWNPNAHNRSSGAHGIPQSLPASKMASEGSDYYTNGQTQIRWGLKYIAGRYGSPSNAWNFFLSHNSY